MTILYEPLYNIAKGAGAQKVQFAVPRVRLSFDGTATITKALYFPPISGGVMTTHDLDPGPVEVTIGLETRTIDVPDSGLPLRLQPLWDAAEDHPDDPDGFVRNAGGLDRMQVMTESQYAALTPPDPNTIYILFPA